MFLKTKGRRSSSDADGGSAAAPQKSNTDGCCCSDDATASDGSHNSTSRGATTTSASTTHHRSREDFAAQLRTSAAAADEEVYDCEEEEELDDSIWRTTTTTTTTLAPISNLTAAMQDVSIAVPGLAFSNEPHQHSSASSQARWNENQVREAVFHASQAWNRADLQAYVDCYCHNARYVSSSLAPRSNNGNIVAAAASDLMIVGKDAIAQRFRAVLERSMSMSRSAPTTGSSFSGMSGGGGRIEFSRLDIQMMGDDFADVSGCYNLERNRNDVDTGFFTQIMKKEAAGVWRIQSRHSSATPKFVVVNNNNGAAASLSSSPTQQSRAARLGGSLRHSSSSNTSSSRQNRSSLLRREFTIG